MFAPFLSSIANNNNNLSCFPLLSSASALNLAYPNYPLSSYNGHLLSLPLDDSQVIISGAFPSSSFVQFTCYAPDDSFRVVDNLVDYDIVPDRGINPFLHEPQSDTDAVSHYTIEISTSNSTSSSNHMQCSPRSGLIMRVFNDESSFDPAESPYTAKQYTKEMVWGSVSPPVVEFVNGASSLLPGDCESFIVGSTRILRRAPPMRSN